MQRIKLFLIFIVLMLLLAACSQENTNEVTDEENDTPENTIGEEEKESAIPSDAELIAFVEEYGDMLDEQDLEGLLNLLHRDTPVYEEMEQTMSELFELYVFDFEITDVFVEEKSADEAIVVFTQISKKVEGPEFLDNMVTTAYTLRPEDDDVWKIANVETIDSAYIDEDGEPIDMYGNDSVGEEDHFGGEFIDTILELDLPISQSDDWFLESYEENIDDASMMLLPNGQTSEKNTEFMIVQYLWNGEEEISVSDLLELYLEDLNQQVSTGNYEYDILQESETSQIYMFKLENDDMYPDALEIGRVFVKDGDLYFVRHATRDLDLDIDERIEFLNSLN